MQSALSNARSVITRQNIQSFRRLLLENLEILYSALDPLEQESLVNDLFLPLDLLDLIKLLQLLIKFKKCELIRFIVEYYSLGWILKQNVDVDPIYWEEWINLYYSIMAKFPINASAKLYQDFFSILENDQNRVIGIELDKILAKATRVGDLRTFFIVFKDFEKCELIHDLILKLTMFEQEIFISQLLDFMASDLQNSSQISAKFKENCNRFRKIAGIKEKNDNDNSLAMVIENRLFQKFQDYHKNHLLVHALAGNQDALLGFAQSLLRNWGNQGLISSNSVRTCVIYTNLLLLVLEHLKKENLSQLRLDLISGVSLYLDASNKTIRHCGMIVGQFYSTNLKEGEKLDFELSTEVLDQFKLWMTCTVECISSQSPDFEMLDVKENSKEKKTLGKPSKRIIKSFKFLQDSLQLLKAGDDADPEKIELAMASLPSLIMTASETEISELGIKIAEKIIYYTNDFDISTFDENRMKALISLLIRLPKTMPKYFAQQIYSRNSGMMQRIDVLSAIGYACIELSQLSDIYKEKQTQLISMTGDVVPLEKSTCFSSCCLYFFNPLLSEIHKWYRNDGSTISHIFICRTLSTLGIILKSSATSPYIRVMSRDLFNLLLEFKDCPNTIRSGVLEAFLMLITSLSHSLLLAEFTLKELESAGEIALLWTSSQDSQISDLAFSFLHQLSLHV